MITLNQLDNVSIVIKDYEKGEIVDNITLKEEIKVGHKVAIKDISQGENIIKYGVSIGVASKDIKIGDWVHTHNVKSNLKVDDDWQYNKNITHEKPSEFNFEITGYRRADGLVGIRNNVFVIPTVGCISGILKTYIAQYEKDTNRNVVFIDHKYGCSQSSIDFENTKKVLENTINHPNSGFSVVVALGCENNQLSNLKLRNHDISYIELQNESDEYEILCQQLDFAFEKISKDVRVPIDISEIIIGTECGGSDALSGITANPLIGKIADTIINQKATIVTTEIPEFFGAETIALNKCENEEIFEKLRDSFHNYRNFYSSFNVDVYANPSPGNKLGGITTLEEKSMGCVAKIGTTAINNVYNYGEKVCSKGNIIIESPGNDLVATTALAQSGCHLILFSTGRGTPYGGFVPTIKIATNSLVYDKKTNWFDFNAGEILGHSNNDSRDDLLNLIEDTINGKETRNEKNNCFEFAIFKTGVTL